MVLFVCTSCGFEFPTNFITGHPGSPTLIQRNSTICPNCGGLANSVDGMYYWFDTLEDAIKHAGLTKKQAKQIQRKILRAREADTLPVSIDTISKDVGDAVRTTLEKTKSDSEQDKWKWLYRLAALVGIAAGVNTLSSDYNFDAAVEWFKSRNADQIQTNSDEQTSRKAIQKTDKNHASRPR